MGGRCFTQQGGARSSRSLIGDYADIRLGRPKHAEGQELENTEDVDQGRQSAARMLRILGSRRSRRPIFGKSGIVADQGGGTMRIAASTQTGESNA